MAFGSGLTQRSGDVDPVGDIHRAGRAVKRQLKLISGVIEMGEQRLADARAYRRRQ